MTVTIASTTDTEEQVAELNEVANKEPSPDEVTVSPSDSVPSDSDQSGESGDDIVASSETDEELAPDIEASDDSDAEAVGEPEGEESEQSATAEDEPKKKRRRRGRSYKDRASQLAREKAAEQTRANQLQAQVASLQGQLRTPPPAPEKDQDQFVEKDASGSPQAAADGKPEQGNFESYEEYAEALVDWKVSERLQTHEAERLESIERDRAAQSRQDAVATHRGRIDAFRETHEDFDAVIEKAKDLPMSRPMQDSVLNSDSGPALMYHLSQNPEECDRIAGLNPMMAIKEMGKLEARLEDVSTGPSSSGQQLTKAPKPIKPVGGGATASSVKMDDLPYQEYKRQREIQLGVRER